MFSISGVTKTTISLNGLTQEKGVVKAHTDAERDNYHR